MFQIGINLYIIIFFVESTKNITPTNKQIIHPAPPYKKFFSDWCAGSLKNNLYDPRPAPIFSYANS